MAVTWMAVTWIKARASAAATACVELARHDGRIFMRDSKDPEGPMLEFTLTELAAFFDGVKRGEFDHLVG